MAHDVFISYSSKDKVVADAACAALERGGIRCWVAPRDIASGANWAESILKAIAASRMMVLIFSRHAQSSPHIRREVERAVHNGLAIAPVRTEDVMPAGDLEYFLSSSHWMDAMVPPFEQHMEVLAQQVRGFLNIPPPSAPALAPAPSPRATTAAPVPRLQPRRGPLAALGTLAVVTAVGLVGWFAWTTARAPAVVRVPTVVGTPSVVGAPAVLPELAAGQQRFTNTIGVTLVRIEAGEFLMGSPDGEKDRSAKETRHHVRLTKPFMMGIHEVTQRQWTAVMVGNPSSFKGDDLPVEKVSWDYAVEFCNRLSQKERKKYRLPTEAEWEYACRAGATTAYGFGDDAGKLDDYGWYLRNSGAKTHPVGQLKPNAWGLYDMHGNVFEWCADWSGEYSAGDAVDPTGPVAPPAANQASRVLRGGSWLINPDLCRASYRGSRVPTDPLFTIGFRLCLDLE